MFWKRSTNKKCGPTGSNRFIDNIDWWFWDNSLYPCLISRDNFSTICQNALTEEEHKHLVLALMLSDIITEGRHNVRASKEMDRLLKRVSDYLLSQRLSTIEEILCWRKPNFSKDCTKVLKAYVNIIESWGYPYSWVDGMDAQFRPGVILLSEVQPPIFFRDEDVMYIHGPPFHFEVSSTGMSWWFSTDSGRLKVLDRGKVE